jgi:hypothetical protein
MDIVGWTLPIPAFRGFAELAARISVIRFGPAMNRDGRRRRFPWSKLHSPHSGELPTVAGGASRIAVIVFDMNSIKCFNEPGRCPKRTASGGAWIRRAERLLPTHGSAPNDTIVR